MLFYLKQFVKTNNQGDIEAVISSHYMRENSLRRKLKADKVLYLATNLDASRQTSLEDSIHTESGVPLTEGKDKTSSLNTQGKSEENDKEAKVYAKRCAFLPPKNLPKLLMKMVNRAITRWFPAPVGEGPGWGQ